MLFSRNIYAYNAEMARKSRNIRLPFSRRRRQQITFSLLPVLLALFLAQRMGFFKTPPGSDQQLYHEKTFKVIKVVDGDTIDLNVPDPHNDKSYTRVRLWGVDTPETKHPKMGVMYFGPEASEFSTEMVLNKQVAVHLEPFQNTRGKYHRLLAYIYLPDGKMLNEELIKNGYGYADPRFKHMLRQKFKQLGNQAQKEKLGLWKNIRLDQCPGWYQQRHTSN